MSKKFNKPATRSLMAVALQSPLFSKQIVKSKKGRGSYSRKSKHVNKY